MVVGQMLREKRTALGLKQEEVAEKIQVSRQTLSNWENEKTYPDIVSILKLSELYGVTTDELLKGDAKLVKHLDESTNVVKSNRRMTVVSVVCFLLFSLFLFIPEFSRGNDLGSGNVPPGMGRGDGFSLMISGSVVAKLMLLAAIAAAFVLIVYLVRLYSKKLAAGDVKWKSVTRKRDVVCLSALLLILVCAILMLWISP